MIALIGPLDATEPTTPMELWEVISIPYCLLPASMLHGVFIHNTSFSMKEENDSAYTIFTLISSRPDSILDSFHSQTAFHSACFYNNLNSLEAH